jgi:hypothetical protein
VAKKIGLLQFFSTKLPKVNNWPTGEISTNLVTLSDSNSTEGSDITTEHQLPATKSAGKFSTDIS